MPATGFTASVGAPSTARSAAAAAVVQSVKQAKARAHEAFATGDFAESVKWFGEALTLSDTAAGALVKGTQATAAHDAEMLATQAEEQTSLLLNRAAAWARLGDHRHAIEDSDAVLLLDPSSARAHLRKGKSRLKLQEYAAAAEAFRSGLAFHPVNGDMRRGFDEALRGLRVNWHRYCPAYTHVGSSAHVPSRTDLGANSTPASAVATSRVAFTPAPRARDVPGALAGMGGAGFDDGAVPVEPEYALRDAQIEGVLREVGGMMNLASVMSTEAEVLSALGCPLESVDVERATVIGVILEYQEVLLHLFCKYCELPVRASRVHADAASRAADASRMTVPDKAGETTGVVTGAGGGAASAAAAKMDHKYRPISARRSLSEAQFWQFCVDSGLVTRTFNRRAVQAVWTAAMSNVLNSAASTTAISITKSTRHLLGPAQTYEEAAGGGGDGAPGTGADESIAGFTVEPTAEVGRPTATPAAGPPSGSLTARGRLESSAGPRGSASMVRARGFAANAGKQSSNAAAVALFPKFVEALIRLSAARYRPVVPDKSALLAERAAKAAASRRRSPRRAARGGDGFGTTSRGPGSAGAGTGRDADDERPEGVPTLSARLAYSLQAHVLSHPYATVAGSHAFADGADAEDEDEWERAQAVLVRLRARLKKVFRFFAADDASKREMDIREFLYMLKSLGVADYRNLTLREAARTVVAVTGFVGDASRQRLEFPDFCEALARCCDVKTHDGIVPVSKRLETWLVADFFQRCRSKCPTMAALWR